MLPERYNISNIQRIFDNPSLVRRELGRLVSKFIFPINNRLFERKYGNGIDVMSKDWDNLIILDACRYDYFSEQNTIPGSLDRVLSKGAHSWEFMRGNFAGESLHDTVYVTGNPHTPKLPDNTFHHIDMLHNPSKPESTVERAINAHEEYPDKRLIVHIMSPHAPHLGKTAKKLRERNSALNMSENDGGINIWKAVIEKQVTRKELCQAYQESVDIALECAETLTKELNGKSVITSDHGEMLGEKTFPLTHRQYSHPHNLYTSDLRFVPWLEVEEISEDRREVVSEPPTEFNRPDKETVDDRLEALGYKS
ncbi:hypothetical protein [Haloarcula argentinensis]|uniref:Sulfatase N-terminal domain-containing protein n=1 Tax=Haloarcula argentinensis TaxID=43776 RepID=A0A830FV05_HALAR|nr:hypothetical protein [Haloarcula argentinensis]MDS0254112.1 hypothetical protein [Haloarcula argentinensis]GGM44105.1 hypothetical protein GCM10009006_26790 [Haloarcula argentinensis]